MIWLFISYKKHPEWRFEANPAALLEDMTIHAMRHFGVESDEEHFLEYEDDEGDWYLAGDDQTLSDLFPNWETQNTARRLRLVRGDHAA